MSLDRSVNHKRLSASLAEWTSHANSFFERSSGRPRSGTDSSGDSWVCSRSPVQRSSVSPIGNPAQFLKSVESDSVSTMAPSKKMLKKLKKKKQLEDATGSAGSMPSNESTSALERSLSQSSNMSTEGEQQQQSSGNKRPPPADSDEDEVIYATQEPNKVESRCHYKKKKKKKKYISLTCAKTQFFAEWTYWLYCGPTFIRLCLYVNPALSGTHPMMYIDSIAKFSAYSN
ncbi:PREDICTED: uncharacterized protein LOC105462400 isoform X2 [Wasmannia auropunctata]|uniref:uncharacterized protein LOC105462400 isoform X2 n=1 Tax=Wasmannia auropunctata TaxID=64793 RepID=UPI0005EE98CD|nr:PREDICTED: uncharacterized protein LOC105462400 isoform X2 [Wasmannia auropunctata]